MNFHVSRVNDDITFLGFELSIFQTKLFLLLRLGITFHVGRGGGGSGGGVCQIIYKAGKSWVQLQSPCVHQK